MSFEELGDSAELEGVEDSVELEDLEFLKVLECEDLLCLPIFFYFRYIFLHLLIIF